MAKISKTFQYGKHQVTLETGEIARQAGGAVLVKVDGKWLVASILWQEETPAFPLPTDMNPGK